MEVEFHHSTDDAVIIAVLVAGQADMSAQLALVLRLSHWAGASGIGMELSSADRQ